MQPAKPLLYTASPGGAAPPRLKGGACRRCGYVFHPQQSHGCERCGSTGDALQPQLLEGTGELVASVRVLIHADAERAPPFVVVSVKLDAGPVVRTLLAQDSTQNLAVGTRMQACLVEVARSAGGDAALGELRFFPFARSFKDASQSQ